MHRTFVTSFTRRQQYLDGFWQLVQDPQDVGFDEQWHHGPPPGRAAWVPGVWNTLSGWLHYEGVAWYSQRFTVQACQAVRITFGAVTHQANVWLDGEPVGQHYGGWLPFALLTQLAPGEHLLVVRVDNRHDMTATIPSSHLDWFRYGGITRPVLVEELAGPGYVAALRLVPDWVDGQGILKVRAELTNLSDRPLEAPFELQLDGQTVKAEPRKLGAGASDVVAFALRLDDIEPWEPGAPRLYTCCLRYGGDELIERTGFRHVCVERRHILINGKPVFIKGVNRHEDHPEWGAALPEHLMARDLDLIEDLGANAVRGSHYPNDPRFLDLCDERGILFVAEIPLWQFSGEQMDSNLLTDRATAMMWAMVERDISHPAVIAWSMSNECATETSQVRLAMEHLRETIEQIDDTRLITFASHRAEQDICFDLADVACVNAYYGWYRHDLTWGQFLDRMARYVGDKPLIVSEFGAGALYGWRVAEPDVIWSEEYQLKLLTECISLFMARDDCAGFFIWQFCDTRTDRGDDGHRALMRPRHMNNKGIVDEYRRKKLAFDAVRALLRDDES